MEKHRISYFAIWEEDEQRRMVKKYGNIKNVDTQGVVEKKETRKKKKKINKT